LSEQILVSGIVKLSLQGQLSGHDYQVILDFQSQPKLGVKQTLNFGAVKALAALGGGGTIRAIASADFHYQKIAGTISLKKGYLTVNGLAGSYQHYQYLVRSARFGQGINVLVDPQMNTIRLPYLLARIQDAIGHQGKVEWK